MRPEDQETILYYRLRSAISDGNVDGVRQILKLRTMRNARVWKKLCPHVVWDRLGTLHPDTKRLWFDILGSDFEDCLEVIKGCEPHTGEHRKIVVAYVQCIRNLRNPIKSKSIPIKVIKKSM